MNTGDNSRLLLQKFQLRFKMIENERWVNTNDFKQKVIIDPKMFKLIDDHLDEDDFVKIKSNSTNQFYVRESHLFELVKQLKSHPEHYNAHLAYGLNIKFKKQEEIETLAFIYQHYRKTNVIHYQHPELEFRMDTNIVIEAGRCGGLAIEIDEKTHGKYDTKDHEDRQKILESCGYYFIRIIPGQYEPDVLIEKIDSEIANYQLIYSKEIDVESLWNKLKDESIDRQFFDMIGKSVVSSKKFCVNFDDVIDFVEYNQKVNAVRKLQTGYREGIDFIIISKEQIEDRDDISFALPVGKANRGGHNKMYIFLTKFAMYSFILECQTRKAKEIRTHVIDIYNTYHDLLVFCKNELQNKNSEENTKKALELYKKRQEQKFNSLKQSKNRENDMLKETNQTLSKQRNDYKRENIIYKNEIAKYKNLYQQYEQDVKTMMDSLNKIASECKDKNFEKKLKKKIANVYDL